MIEQANPWGRHRLSRIAAAFVMAVALGLLSPACRAEGGSAPAPQLRTLLASANALSESAMAKQTATGLRPPSVSPHDTATTVPRVMLWDEMRLGPLLAPANDGIVSGGGR